MKYLPLLTIVAAAGLLFTFSGCDSSSNEPAGANTPSDDHSGHSDSGGDGQSDMEKMKVELAKMSPEDAASAESQHMCPVSGEMLGTMGAPIKVDVNGKDVWICCAGCEDTLLGDPDTYLSKLKKE